MTMEVPLLHLGMAGYTEAQQHLAAQAAKAAANERVRWDLVQFTEADAWWLEGRHTLMMPNRHLRVQPAIPSGRSVQIASAEVDRPVAFTLPVTCPDLKPAVTFDLDNQASAVAVLNRFAGWMRGMLAQFALGTSIADNQPTLAAGSWEVLRGGTLLAVVDLRLGTAVDVEATPEDFAEASWCVREHGAVMMPAGFARASVSQLMWQYARRSERDLLPPHYRYKPLYFRRPPRVAQRQMKDAHLLLMRELVSQPGMTFLQLQQATGLGEVQLARCLSALYVVGSITSNPRRATGAAILAAAVRDSVPPGHSSFPSVLDPDDPQHVVRRPNDLTAPMPLLHN